MGKVADVPPRGDIRGEESLQYQAVPSTSEPSRQKSISIIKWLIAIIGALTIMTTEGCASRNNDKYRVPGSPRLNDFGIHFTIDYKVFDSGTWIYVCGDSVLLCHHKMGGGRSGYIFFDILTLDFKFKDGRSYHEEIDLRPLIAEMIKTNTIPDLRKTKWGGSVDVEIHVKTDKLSLVYVISERIKKENPPMMLYKDYRFPLFEKALN